MSQETETASMKEQLCAITNRVKLFLEQERETQFIQKRKLAKEIADSIVQTFFEKAQKAAEKGSCSLLVYEDIDSRKVDMLSSEIKAFCDKEGLNLAIGSYVYPGQQRKTYLRISWL